MGRDAGVLFCVYPGGERGKGFAGVDFCVPTTGKVKNLATCRWRWF